MVPARKVAFGDLPEIHFSPHRNWLNDPNGLVFHEGRYHLYYQYNPNGATHGCMSWGHASSSDLITWDEHPVALRYDDDQEIYSGSVIWDGEGTAGFGPALIAFYTSNFLRRRHQAQSLAYSRDDGLTWTNFEGNPVLDRDSGDFRDPKVLRYSGPAGDYWVMVAVEAAERRVVFYRSENLTGWDLLSEFAAPELGEGIWECPDLFPLQVDGLEKWVLILSLGWAPAVGGFGTVYFVGSFDGTTFVAEGDSRPLDHGRDNYAGVSFFGLPDEQRTLIGWMSNWHYAGELPVIEDEPRRGAMTLARRLSLASVNDRFVLRQEPVGPDLVVTGEVAGFAATTPSRLPLSLPACCRIDVDLDLGSAAGAQLRLRHDPAGAGGVTITYARASGDVILDRAEVGPEFPEAFRAEQIMPTGGGSKLAMTLWLDLASLEIFADDGLATLTSLIDVAAGDGVSVEGIDGDVELTVRVSARTVGCLP